MNVPRQIAASGAHLLESNLGKNMPSIVGHTPACSQADSQIS
jgi:hypothetical protein